MPERSLMEKKASVNLINWLKSPGPLKPFYSVVGNELFFISEIKKTFIKTALPEKAARDFNYNELSGDKTSLGTLMTVLETLPFMSKKRLVFCDKAEKFPEKDWEKLEPVLSAPSPHFVLVCFFEKKDGRKKHFKFLQKKAIELSAEPLRAWEVKPWLNFISKREGLEFSPPAQSLFLELMSPNLMEIQLELKKLQQYIGERKQVSEKDVLSCASRLKNDSLFDLTAAIGRKDMVQSLNLLAHLLGQNQNEMGLLALLARHIRILSKIQEGEKQKLGKNQLAQKAGIPPYFLKNYLNQAQLWSERQIQETLEALFSTDKALKSSPLSSHIWLENFILKVCS